MSVLRIPTRYLYNTLYIFSEQALKIASVLILNFILARYLGVESFGVLNYSIAIVMLFCNSIAKLGIEDILIKEYITWPEKRLSYIGTSFWLRTLGALLSLLFVSLYSFFDDQQYQAYFLILSVLPFLYATEVVEYYFQSQLQAKIVSFCRVLNLLCAIAGKLYLVHIKADFSWFIASYVLDQFVHTASLLLIFRSRALGNFFKFFDPAVAKILLNQSWPLIITNLSVMLYMRISTIMIKELMTINDVGYYSAAIRISEGWYFVPTLLTASLFPAIVNAKALSTDLYESRLKHLVFVLFWGSFAVSVLVTVFSEDIIGFVFGKAFLPAAEVLSWHIWTGLFVAIGVTNTKWIISENMQHRTFTNTVIGASINILLNVLLIPRYGLKGAAFSTLVANALSNYLLLLFNKHTRPRFYSITRSIFLPLRPR